MLNGISSHRVRSSLFGLPREMFVDSVLKRTGPPDSCLAIVAAIDDVARHKAKHKWHSLHAIEARVPFLDRYLTEYVNNLPPSVKINYPTEK